MAISHDSLRFRILPQSIEATDALLPGAMRCPFGLTCNIIPSHYKKAVATRKGDIAPSATRRVKARPMSVVDMCPSHLRYGVQY